jgi:thiol-disulfide isomerase/thioredoxin
MKKSFYLFAFSLLFCFAFGMEKVNGQAKKVILNGKVLNVHPDKYGIDFYIHRLGFGQEHIYSQLDSLGNFSATIESYIPTDVWVLYKTNFLVLTHPGDSIYFEFDGEKMHRPEILKSIKFGGNATKTNRDAAVFQEMYFSDSVYKNFELVSKAQKEYDADDYLLFMDTLRQKRNEIYQKFISKVSPNNETKIWALTYIDGEFYDAIAFYPYFHKSANQLKDNDWNVPPTYIDILLNRLPIKEDMFISGYALSNFINRFHFNYLFDRVLEDSSLQKYKTEIGGIKAPYGLLDSMLLYGILDLVDDNLLRQMILTELFSQFLSNKKIEFFEQHYEIVNQYIREQYLIEPLIKQYNQLKDWNSNPQFASNAVLKKLINSSAKQIMDSILTTNKGKVIYIDCWATWCSPCRAEFPDTKILMSELVDKSVVFVFLCIDSQENGWKSTLAEFQLGGQQYFLSQEQSSDLRLSFDIKGIPYYMLVDKQGTIIEKGSYLRPKMVNEKIVKLFEE